MANKTIIAWINGAAQSIEVPDVAYVAPPITMEDKVSALITMVTLSASNWEGTASPYAQTIMIDGVTSNSMVDLQPSPEQLVAWQDAGLAFTTSNSDGVINVYVSGDLPTEDIDVQVRIQEVVVI